MAMLTLHELCSSSRTKHKDKVPYRFHEFVSNKQSHLRIPTDFIRMEPWEVRYLHIVASHSRLGKVEIGRYAGGSTLILSSASESLVTSIDNQPKNDEFLKSLLLEFNLTNVDLKIEDSRSSHRGWSTNYDFLFIDGDHSYDGCFQDLVNWWPALAPGGHLICHDCYWTDGKEHGVQQAVVNYLKRRLPFHDYMVHVSPYIPSDHWNKPYGSLCHIQKVR